MPNLFENSAANSAANSAPNPTASPTENPALTPEQRRVLVAAGLGWTLDGMDAMLYAFALPAIAREFQLGGTAAGSLAAITLLSSAVGGVLFGWLADVIGRARALQAAVLVYALSTAGAATSTSLQTFLIWRLLLGLGLGGEWAAGATLVAESVPAQRRGQALGLVQSGWAVGFALAALLATFILPRWGFRALFLVGASPALLALWIRARVAEPAAWLSARLEGAKSGGAKTGDLRLLLQPVLLRRAGLATLLSAVLMCAYWGLFTWIPSYLATPLDRGGPGLSSVRALSFLLPMQAGAFLGYVAFGVLADRYGRRPVFCGYVLAAALAVPLFVGLSGSPGALLFVAPILGFAGHGYFSVFGALIAELFPLRIRGSAGGFCYNAGKALSAVSPPVVGLLADRYSLGAALALLSGLYVLGAMLIWALPETRGEDLS
jgi:MFS family permease